MNDTDLEPQADVDLEPPLDPKTEKAVVKALAEADKRCAADPELVHGDVVEALAQKATLEVAVPLCERGMGFLPDTVRQRVFASENEDSFQRAAVAREERETSEAKSKQRSQRAAATRASTIAAEQAVESAKVRSATCPDCFTVRSPSGACACQ